MLALHLLGPVELRRDGVALTWPSRKCAALLLRLALAGPQTRPQLVALLWPGHDESTGRRNLRRELARLRDVGAGDAVQADGDRLGLAGEVELDLTRMVALLDRQEPEAALAHWRGPLADGLVLTETPEFADWLAGERERLHARWRDALAAQAAAAEAAGHPGQALAALERLLADDPLQEHHHRSLMRLQAAAGRREAALQQYERCRRLLADELGLQPMPETVALAQALHLEPALPMAPAPRRVWPGELPFVGREAEVARLQQAFGTGRPIVLAGEAGVGKTRLAVDFAASQGAHAFVRCQPGDAELPFAAFVRVLRTLAGQPPDLRGLEGWVAGELARVLPELGPPPPPLANEGERLRFDEACIRAWTGLAHGAFDAIVLDDWHLADAGSRALLARVTARRRVAGPGGAVEILAWRGAPDDVALRAECEALAAELVLLERLPPHAVHTLVRHLTGAEDPVRFAARLADATGGLPFFIAETLRDLSERGLLARDDEGRWSTPYDADTADYRELPLAASVRDAVLARLHRLDPGAARLLEAAALAGEPIGAARLAPACALSESEALQAIAQAAQAHLLQAHDDGGYGWVHDLARQAIDGSLAPTRRRLLHHQLALAAEAQGDAATAARHFEACGEATRAAPHRRAAGDAAMALHALAEAAAHWRQGLADRPTPAEELMLLARLCETAWNLGHSDEARAFHERLVPLLDTVPLDPTVRTDALLRTARFLSTSGQSALALRRLEDLPPPDPGPQRLAWWHARIGAMQQCGQLDAGSDLVHTALQTPGLALGDRADLLLQQCLLAFSQGRMAAGVAHAGDALALFRRLGHRIGEARALYLRGCCRMAIDERDAGAGDLRSAAALAGQCGHLQVQRLALYNLAAAATDALRHREALALAEEAWCTLRETPRDELAVLFRTLFIEAHHIGGDWGAMWAHLVPAVEDALALGQPMLSIGVANAAVEAAAVLGQWARVAPLVQSLDAGVLGTLRDADEVVLGCAQAALLRDDVDAAGRWLDRMPPPDGQEHLRVQGRHAVLRAHHRLAGGATDLDGLPADDGPGMRAELRLRALALRLRLRPDAALQARARAALDDPDTHAGIALALAQGLGDQVLRGLVERRAATLAAWPEVQASLRATWRV